MLKTHLPEYVPVTSTSADYRIGMDTNRYDYPFYGNMYDYRHFDRTLSEDEISYF